MTGLFPFSEIIFFSSPSCAQISARMHLNFPEHWGLPTGTAPRGLVKVFHNLADRGKEILTNSLNRAAYYMGRRVAIKAGQKQQSHSPPSVYHDRWEQGSTIISASPESAVGPALFIRILLTPGGVYSTPTIIS